MKIFSVLFLISSVLPSKVILNRAASRAEWKLRTENLMQLPAELEASVLLKDAGEHRGYPRIRSSHWIVLQELNQGLEI